VGGTSVLSYLRAGFLVGTTALGSPSASFLPYGFVPIARPFVIGSTVYIPTILYFNSTSLQGTFYLLQQNPSTAAATFPNSYPCAMAAPRQVDLATVTNGFTQSTGPSSTLGGPNHLPFGSVAVPTTKQAIPVRSSGSDSQAVPPPLGVSQEAGLNLALWTANLAFGDGRLYQAAELGGELHISGGIPMVCDGQAVFEDDFFYYPEYAGAGTFGTGTTLTTGNYQYAVVYVYPDAAGNVHRSAPFFTNIVAITNGAAYPTVSFPVLVTLRDLVNPGQTFAEIYRTIASPPSPVYYLLDRVSASNSPSLSFITYGDNNINNSNATLQTQTLVYTTGGVLDQPNPPASHALCIHKNRVVQDDDTRRVLWFTEQYVTGSQPGYNETLTIAMPDGGDITALASMDSELIVFKASSIWIIYGGDGPNQLGTGSDLTTPQRVPSDVGCVDWRSVVLTPMGLLFASASGIYMLSRALEVSYIGRNVADLFAAYPVCVGAVLVPNTTQVRFAMTTTIGTASIGLVYDYLLQWWAQHTYPSQGSPLAALAVSQRGAYSALTDDGSVWQEGSGWFDQTNASANVFVPTVVTTAEIKVQGAGALQAYQRVRKVQLYADQVDPAQIAIGLAFNGIATQVASRSWSYNQLKGLPYNLISMDVPAAYTRGMSVQVTLSDASDPATVTGQGVNWNALALEIEALAGRYPQTPKGNR